MGLESKEGPVIKRRLIHLVLKKHLNDQVMDKPLREQRTLRT